MFTGMIEQQGIVLSSQNHGMAKRLMIQAQMSDLTAGESIAVNGVCLTQLAANTQLLFDVSPETLKITTLGQLQAGDVVNLERAVLASTRLGGHYVSGHVDTCAEIRRITTIDDYRVFSIGGFSDEQQMFLLKKASITINGVSLTINEVMDDEISLMLVPHTMAHTTFKHSKVHDWVNVEFDYMTRMVVHTLGHYFKSQTNQRGVEPSESIGVEL